MIHFYCSAVEYLSQKSYKYTRVGLVWRSANSLPSSSVCLSLPSRESRPPFDSASYRAPAEARSRGRPARLASELLSNLCSDSDLRIRIRFYYPRTLWERGVDLLLSIL